MRRTFAWLLSTGLTLMAVLMPVEAQGPGGPPLRSPDSVWGTAPDRAARGGAPARALDGPAAIVRLNKDALDAILDAAPDERDASGLARAATAAGALLTLPMPDGTFARFAVLQSPMLAPELAIAFPDFKTYSAAGIDDPTATARLDWTAAGFHAMVIAESGTVYVDPYAPGDLEFYIAFRKGDLRRGGAGFVCLLHDDADPFLHPSADAPFFAISNGATLRTYRLALAATAEYTAAAGGTKPLALSRMTTSMNRVNAIYERELAVRMTMAAGTMGDPTALIFTDPATDGYTNDDGNAMLGENQTKINAVVGTGNYDVGHVFSTGGGGVATLNSPCNVSNKARGVTGLPNPVGDVFDVDFVSHEMGHQFGGHHTFNSTTDNCGGGNRSAAHAVEVGSGSTIQAYAGICGVEDIQRNSHDYFHAESLREIQTFILGAGACSVNTATGNTVPSVTPNANVTIPKQTPIALTAAGSDANGDALTYTWEEYDLGAATSSVATASTDEGTIPLFRSHPPASSPTRSFPSRNYVLNNANLPPTTFTGTNGANTVCAFGTCLTGEVLPSFTRATMKFIVTVRDNRAGGGGFATGLTTLAVDGGKGPFTVTSPNTAISVTGNTSQNVTWDVNGTAALAANVRILLSTDGGLTFPSTLAASTPNDGSESVVIPNLATTTARVRIEAVGNVFYDVSNTNFTIVNGVNTPPTIGSVGAQVVFQGGPSAPIAVTVGDAETPSSLTLSAVAANTALLPSSAFAFGGSGTSRTMTITPVPGQLGTTSVTLTVSDGAATASTNFNVAVMVVDDVPQNFAASVSGSTVSFTWLPVAGATNYTLVARSTPSGAVIATLPIGGAGTSFSVSAPPGIYYVTVAATVSGTLRGPSNQVGLAVGLAPAPINLATTATASSFGVTWNHSPIAAGRTGYQLRVGTRSGLTDQAVLGLPAAATSFDTSSVIAGVPFGRYYISIVALPAGAGSTSAEVIATVGTPPVLTRTGSTLSWTASGSPSSYRLEVGFAPGTTALELPVSGTSFPIPPGVTGTYFVRVAAVYGFGNSLASNEITLALPDQPTTTPDTRRGMPDWGMRLGINRGTSRVVSPREQEPT